MIGNLGFTNLDFLFVCVLQPRGLPSKQSSKTLDTWGAIQLQKKGHYKASLGNQKHKNVRVLCIQPTQQ